MHPRILSVLRRGAALVPALALVAALPLVVVPQARAGAPLFEEIGTLDRFPEDAREALGEEFVPTWETVTSPDFNGFKSHLHTVGAIVIPEVRQLWQLYPTGTNDQRTGAVVRDLDSLAIVKTLVLPEVIERATTSGNSGGDWAHAVDAVHGRLFLVTERHTSVTEIDLATFAVRDRPLLASTLGDSTTPKNPLKVVPLVTGGITYDPVADDLLVLYGAPPENSAANTNTFLYALDVGGPPGEATAGSLRHIRSCTGPVMSTDLGGENYDWEILVTREHLYVPCSRAGHTAVVVRTKRSSEPREEETVAAGPVYAENALADQAGGRLVFTTYIGKEIWTFEAATMSFVGIAATGPPRTEEKTGYGLDRATGRVFFQSPTFGLGVVEGRFFPLPQARRAEHRATGRERILSDARTNRVFVLEGFHTKARAYRIYRVAPAPVPPPPPDPDRNTVDRSEEAGVTEARYNAGASGYGARALLAKGLTTVVPAPTAGVIAPTAQFFENSGNSKCGFTDRELVAGRVFRSEYDTGSASAEAVAVDVDGATKQDLDKPSRCDMVQKGGDTFKGLFGTGPLGPELDERTQADDPDTPTQEQGRWRWSRASCSSSEERPATGRGATETEAKTDTAAGFGPSEVSCPEPGGTLTAAAETDLDGESLEVGRAWTETKVERRPGAGVVASVTAVSQDVTVRLAGGPEVGFAEIRSSATSATDGRPPETRPMSRHGVSIRGATLDGAPLCEKETARECEDLTGLVEALNTAAAGRAVFRTGAGDAGGLDAALVQGSKKGAQTAVQKSAARQASDRSLTGDFTVEVAGLEILTFNDNTNWGRARQLYQFAGVATTATYNIVVRPSGLSVPDLGPFGSTFGDLGAAGEAPFEGSGGSLPGDPGEGTGFDTAAADAGEDADDGGFWAPLRAVARGLRLFLTDPRHALLLLTAWALLGLPGALSRRRRRLAGVRAG